MSSSKMRVGNIGSGSEEFILKNTEHDDTLGHGAERACPDLDSPFLV